MYLHRRRLGIASEIQSLVGIKQLVDLLKKLYFDGNRCFTLFARFLRKRALNLCFESVHSRYDHSLNTYSKHTIFVKPIPPFRPPFPPSQSLILDRVLRVSRLAQHGCSCKGRRRFRSQQGEDVRWRGGSSAAATD